MPLMTELEQQNVTQETAVSLQPTPAPLAQKLLMIGTASVVLLADQLTKLLVETKMPLNTTWEPFSSLGHLFRITHVANTGTAFGLFPNGSFLFGALAIVVGLFLVYYNHILPANQTALRLALGLQLGGAVGNLIDRLRIGHVTDFLDFGWWPVFNVADMAIVGGVIVLAWMMLKEYQEEQKATQSPVVND
ncbi:MAG: hypothetical protein Kow0080_34830 [Candidatus Promineifilaceae bacterium]